MSKISTGRFSVLRRIVRMESGFDHRQTSSPTAIDAKGKGIERSPLPICVAPIGEPKMPHPAAFASAGRNDNNQSSSQLSEPKPEMESGGSEEFIMEEVPGEPLVQASFQVLAKLPDAVGQVDSQSPIQSLRPNNNVYIHVGADSRTPQVSPNTSTPNSGMNAQKTTHKKKENRAEKRKAHVAFGMEGKKKIPGKEGDVTSTKSYWHAAAKEVAYRVLDLRKRDWKEYSDFEKKELYKELHAQFSFDPPLHPKKLYNYLSGHLRTQRAAWKGHWERYGESNKAPNCPIEAWETLTKWWPSAEAQREAADMAKRRAQAGAAHNPPTAMELDPDSSTPGSEDKRAEPQCTTTGPSKEVEMEIAIWKTLRSIMDAIGKLDQKVSNLAVDSIQMRCTLDGVRDLVNLISKGRPNNCDHHHADDNEEINAFPSHKNTDDVQEEVPRNRRHECKCEAPHESISPSVLQERDDNNYRPKNVEIISSDETRNYDGNDHMEAQHAQYVDLSAPKSRPPIRKSSSDMRKASEFVQEDVPIETQTVVDDRVTERVIRNPSEQHDDCKQSLPDLQSSLVLRLNPDSQFLQVVETPDSSSLDDMARVQGTWGTFKSVMKDLPSGGQLRLVVDASWAQRRHKITPQRAPVESFGTLNSKDHHPFMDMESLPQNRKGSVRGQAKPPKNISQPPIIEPP